MKQGNSPAVSDRIWCYYFGPGKPMYTSDFCKEICAWIEEIKELEEKAEVLRTGEPPTCKCGACRWNELGRYWEVRMCVEYQGQQYMELIDGNFCYKCGQELKKPDND